MPETDNPRRRLQPLSAIGGNPKPSSSSPDLFEEGEVLLLNADAARLLRWKPQTLRKKRLNGDGPPYVRLGNGRRSRVAYRLSDLKAWVAARIFTSTAQETQASVLGTRR